MDYEPSAGKLKLFEDFARGREIGTRVTKEDLFQAGVVPGRNEAARFLHYLYDFGVMERKGGGYHIADMDRITIAIEGRRVKYPKNPEEPVIIYGREVEEAYIPEKLSLELYGCKVYVIPSRFTLKIGTDHVVKVVSIIESSLALDNVNVWLLQNLMKEQGISQFSSEGGNILFPEFYQLSASNVANSVAQPIAIISYLTSYQDVLESLRGSAENIMDHEERLNQGRRSSRPDASYDYLWQDYRTAVRPFVEIESPRIKEELVRMMLELWNPESHPEESLIVPAAEVKKEIKSKGLFGWLKSVRIK